MNKIQTPYDAVGCIKPGDNVYLHTAVAAPQILIEAMVDRADELSNVEIYQLHTEGKARYADEKYDGIFHVNTLFIGENVRKAVNEGRADFIPCFLSEVPIMFRRNIIPIDVALIQVSPPDKHGFCSLGVSVDATKAAIEMAREVVVQINPQMPRTHGDSLIHVNKFSHFVEYESSLPEIEPKTLSDIEMKIGEYIASLIDDGATIQTGIGAIPDAALASMINHKDLGMHSEMFSDGILPLMEKGVITGKFKRKHTGVIVAGFLLGSRKLYDYVDDNPMVRMLDIQYVNDTAVIRMNPKVASINSAIEVDYTGQVCADSIGTRMYSGVGGQMDFIRGASLSEGGKAIVALPSTTRRGETKIVPYLKQGAGVVTTRAHVHYIVTEYGIADLYGKSLKKRARALINIAHPDHREELEREAYARFKYL